MKKYILKIKNEDGLTYSIFWSAFNEFIKVNKHEPTEIVFDYRDALRAVEILEYRGVENTLIRTGKGKFLGIPIKFEVL